MFVWISLDIAWGNYTKELGDKLEFSLIAPMFISSLQVMESTKGDKVECLTRQILVPGALVLLEAATACSVI